MNKNNDSVDGIYMSIRARLARVVSLIVPPREVEDILQETYVRVCQVEDEDIVHPRSFLMRTAKNLALDHIKKAETRLVHNYSEDDEEFWLQFEDDRDETYDKVAANQEFSLFCEAVRQLPPQCRRAFVLKKVYGHSQREIAQELDLSQSTVEKHIAQGVARCRQFMAKYDTDLPSVTKRKRGVL